MTEASTSTSGADGAGDDSASTGGEVDVARMKTVATWLKAEGPYAADAADTLCEED